MTGYKKILIAVEFAPSAAKLIERAQQIAQAAQAQLLLVHVITPMPPVEMMGDVLVTTDWTLNEQELVQGAQQQLEKLAARHGLTGHMTEVLVGDIKTEIAEHAKQRHCDLVVIGAHGRHGLDRLLGSTTDGVTHRVQCDVLAVWLG